MLYRSAGNLALSEAGGRCATQKPALQQMESTRKNHDLLLQVLERVRRRYRFVVLGYVVMPEHVHLLVSEPQRTTLSTAIQALKLGFVRSVKDSDDTDASVVPRSRKGGETWGTPSVGDSKTPNRFWRARFYDFNVWTEKKRIEKLALHSSQSGGAWISRVTGTVAVEQFPLVFVRRGGSGAD